MPWKDRLKPVFSTFNAVLLGALLALRPLELEGSDFCHFELRHLTSQQVVAMPVPDGFATRQQDQIFLPQHKDIYLDLRPESPTTRLIETSLPYLKRASSVLVVGTGASPELVMIARRFPHLRQIHGVDIDPKAIEVSQQSIHLNAKGDARLKVWMSDGLSQVEDKYDLVLFAAPRPVFLETLRKQHGDLSASRMWSMMSRRKDLFDPEGKLRDRILKDMPKVLTPQGRLLLMSDASEEPSVADEFDYLKHGLWLWGSARDGFFTIYDFFRDE